MHYKDKNTLLTDACARSILESVIMPQKVGEMEMDADGGKILCLVSICELVKCMCLEMCNCTNVVVRSRLQSKIVYNPVYQALSVRTLYA